MLHIYCTSETKIILIHLNHKFSINIPEYTTVHPIIDKSEKKLHNMENQSSCILSFIITKELVCSLKSQKTQTTGRIKKAIN